MSVGVEPGGVPQDVTHLGGGPARFAELLDAQLTRRADHRVPRVDHDPGWVLPLPPSIAQLRVAESLGWLGNGWAGTRGSLEEDGADSTPLFLVGGIYDDGGRILPGPVWTGLDLPMVHHRHAENRLLDLRTGTLVRGSSDGVQPAIDALHLCRLPARHGTARRGAGRPYRAGRSPAVSHG